jgi:hypothetical protein
MSMTLSLSQVLAVVALAVALVPVHTVSADDGTAPAAGPIDQLRIYETAPGKLPVLLERFARTNLPVFERHGITLLGAWVPLDADQPEQLVYLVSFPDRAAADAAWAAFRADSEWTRAFEAEKAAHGPVVARVRTIDLAPTDYTPAPDPAEGVSHVYALRTYVTPPGKLDALNARFREHTVALFRKHGIESFAYATPIEAEQGAENTLIYLVRFPSREAADASWSAFRGDPTWQEVKARTEQDGPLTERVEMIYLKPTAFSPLK